MTDNSKTQRLDLQAIVEKVRALRDLTQTTGFQTSRSIGALLGKLSPDDLAEVSLTLQQAPKYGTTGLLHFDAPFPPANEWKRMSSDEQDAWREEHMVRGGK